MNDTKGRVAVALMGPTAAGKTAVAIELAQRLPIDIISVDSAMIYRGMDIGTAKPSRSLLSRYPHALVDIRDPAESYSVADFIDGAKAALASSWARARLPLLVGGTMLYFKALRDGIADIPATPAEVRKTLAERARIEGLQTLHRELERVDPVAARGIHANNPQRLLRALEVYVASGRPISDWWAQQSDQGLARSLDCKLIEVEVRPQREVLRSRIEGRFDDMIAQGFIEEVATLRERGDLDASLPSIRCVGYRQVWDFLGGAIDEEELKLRVLRATRGLAKRQSTWLARFSNRRSFDSAQPQVVSEILQYLDSLAILARQS
ncbi:MAG: tRNA (adenosine(37)-N6)-dimethylallyltransferase MiaA [Gammaproteobacteria bacterium]|nr:tRNA (adenosine(37)-N6)-dimethylallyltransferase MiaA [Gammaproteobacteria bacterium]